MGQENRVSVNSKTICTSAGGCARVSRGFLLRQTGTAVGTPCTAVRVLATAATAALTTDFVSCKVAERKHEAYQVLHLLLCGRFVSSELAAHSVGDRSIEWPLTRVGSERRAVGRYHMSSKLLSSAWKYVSTKRELTQTQPGGNMIPVLSQQSTRYVPVLLKK